MFRLLHRFVPPYRKELCLNVLFNLLSTTLSLFSFAAIIPVLQLLFGLSAEHAAYVPLADVQGLTETLAAVKNNVYWYVEQQAALSGAGWVLFLLGLFLVVMTLLKCLTAWLASFYMVPIRTGVLRDLRQQLYDKVLSLPVGFFTEEKKGDVISRMTSDVGEVENSIMTSIDMLIKDPIMIVVYLVTLFAISWQLTLFVIVLLPLSGLVIGKIGRSLKRRSTRGQEQNADLLSQIEETLGGLRIIKAFNAEDMLSKRFRKLNDDIRQTFNRINRRYYLAHPMSEFLGTVVIALLLWYGGSLILSDRATIDAAEFIYYLVIFYSIINPAKDLSKAVYGIRRGMASVERIDRILNAENNITEPANPKTISLSAAAGKDGLAAAGADGLVANNSDGSEEVGADNTLEKPLISFRDVSFHYADGTDVLRHVSLDIRRGQTVAFVGQSGAGKSTLLDLVPRFYDVTDGAILIAGTDIREVSTRSLRSLMGNVTQEAILFNDTIFNNIAFGVDHATREQVIEAARIANAHDFIMATPLQYDTVIGDRGSRLSGGQRQRLAIARAVLKNPDILILDEATSALDTESEQLVQQALERLMAGRTTLVVAHRLSTIRTADLICVVADGQLVERGTHDQLIRLGGYYCRLIEMQNN